MGSPADSERGGASGHVATACGKVILLGEHAVVYGVPALCGALRGGAEVHLVPGTGALRVPAWGAVTREARELLPGAGRSSGSEDGGPVALSSSGAAGEPPLTLAYRAILRSILTRAGVTEERLAAGADAVLDLDVDFLVRFAIPTGAGLGSSAALAVALVRALDAALDLGLTPTDVEAAALAAEVVFHGSPSGLDHTVAQRGGFGLYRRGQGLTPLAGTPSLQLLVGHTGRARDTKGRVQRVGELYRADPDAVGGRFRRIAGLVEDAVAALYRGDLPALGRMMDENQGELSHLEVSCPEIDRMCVLARQAGALGAKLTGGGGGGCVLALCPGRESDVAEAWRAAGFTSFPVTIGSTPDAGARAASEPSLPTRDHA